jgi:phosphotransferase system enzyme I (PtsI)
VAGESGATVRLFDLGGEKIGVAAEDTERNPALGLRAIRFSLRQEGLLRTQVRAILRAASEVKLQIVLPMVADVTDVRRARRIIDEEESNLRAEGLACNSVKVGAMIEVPSAVMTIGAIVREVDFISLGTNDLVQYLLAVDRGNEEVAEWYRSLHPAVLLSIKRVIEAAGIAGIPTSVCGEMAGTPAYAVVLVGLGVQELSMTAPLIPRMRRTLSAIPIAAAREVAAACLRCAEAEEVEEVVRVELGTRWPEVFSPKSLPGLTQTG